MWVLCIYALLGATVASAADLTHQGRLIDSTGLPYEGTTNLTVSLWTAASGGVLISAHPFPDLPISDGYYSVVLSNVPDAPLSGSVFVAINPDGSGELLPRTRVGATPKAVIAAAVAARPADGSASAYASTSCKLLHATYPDLPSASYWIDLDGTSAAYSPMQVYCDMAFRGGGWTLCYEADLAWGGVTVTGWHNRLNTTARGTGEYGRGCRNMTTAYGTPEAKVVYIDSSYIEARHDVAPSLDNGGYWEFGSYIGPYNIGIEIENPRDPGRGHCFNAVTEDNSWGRAGVSESCFLDTDSIGFYSGLRHVEYWLR